MNMDDISVIFENVKRECNNKSIKINRGVQTEHVNNQKEHPTFFKNAKHFWWQWSENTSLHGARYLGERGRSIIEKLWWMIIFGIALSFCTFWIIRTYNRWITSPIIVSFAGNPTSVWDIPFPAVTVCPEAKLKNDYKKFQYDVFTVKNLTEEASPTVNAANLLCLNSWFVGSKQLFANNIFVDSMIQVTADFNDTFRICTWNGNLNKSCNDLFAPVLTEDGLCYTFNTLDPKDIYTHGHLYYYDKNNRPNTNWKLESGYSEEVGIDSFPRRARSADARLELFLLKGGENCYKFKQGYKISLHRPDVTPRTKRQYFKIGMGEDVIVTVTPNMMSTSDDVKNFPIEKRQCYFSDERKLHFYKNYTQQNCEMECRANYTLKMCGCVEYFMPRNESIQICGAVRANDCWTIFDDYLIEGKTIDCNCLQECTSLSYLAETSQVAVPIDGVPLTFVSIFFKESQFLPTRRSILYSLEDFIANCGGVLGLFIGFSFLSFAEIIYFLTLRVFCNIRRFGKYVWSGSSELVIEDKNDVED